LQPELVDDAIDGTFADTEVTLSQFLSYYLCAGLRIQESMTDDLTHELLGTPVITFGASFGAEEGLGTFIQEESADLEIALATIVEFGGGTVNAFGAALALDEHG
jgi:hypothetical protein